MQMNSSLFGWRAEPRARLQVSSVRRRQHTDSTGEALSFYVKLSVSLSSPRPRSLALLLPSVLVVLNRRCMIIVCRILALVGIVIFAREDWLGPRCGTKEMPI